MWKVEHYQRKIAEVEKSLEELRGHLQTSEAKQRDTENRLMVEQSAWKAERASLEAAQKVRNITQLTFWPVLSRYFVKPRGACCSLFLLISEEKQKGFYPFKYFLIFLLIRNWIQSKDSLFFDWFDVQYTYDESFLLLQFWIINVGIVCVVNT